MALILVAHGSRDPRAAHYTQALVHAVRVARPDAAPRAAFLDFETPTLASTLTEVSSTVDFPGGVTVVPLLLTAAYHGQVDVPGEVARAPAGLRVRLAEVLGPVAGAVADERALALLVAALLRRMPPTGRRSGPDALVLGAAGTRRTTALSTVDLVAAALGGALGLPCSPGYAAGGGPTVADSVRAAHANGARRIAVASYFLAPGRLYDRVRDQARESGAVTVAEPLGDAPEIAELVLHRADTARTH